MTAYDDIHDMSSYIDIDTAAPEVAALDRPLPAHLLDLVAGRARRCRDLLDGTG